MEMTEAHSLIIEKISHLPTLLAREVNDFIDFLLLKHKANYEAEERYNEAAAMPELDYLANLESYEESLARGEINW